MTLGFTTIMNDQPNYFVEKVWQSLFETWPGREMSDAYSDYLLKYTATFGREWDGTQLEDLQPKYHSVRRDRHHRWKPGNLIHFVVNNRTASRFQFAPALPCTSVQEIEFIVNENKILLIDGRELSYEEKKAFALNNGFDSIARMAQNSPKGFKGRIVHWTELRY
ncbi:hypothetical protein [Hufsiella ginkgonis]|uniref:Uncharacterized protein n=1 Tax=Hufsiella ginkgonis TaxID=2695274 RepID=A0A7K1XW91_9SPHI|nr:hypothetical protein [Hufsiella ginkgonis]MXV15240.1 hypothetical protein [Hufsiella ginkgonis]